jgi:excisionase family DNA binding protein
VTELNFPIPTELLERVAESIAERAFDLFAERMTTHTPWMTTEEATAYTRIPPGTFDKLAARGRIPSHSADGGRRKLYHREELDRYLGYARRHASAPAHNLMRADAA